MSDERLIDANALEVSFEKNCSGECDNCEHYRIHHASFTKWEMHCGMIRNAPTIDAVPVVRCEHCKEAVECQLYGEHCGLPAEKGIFCEVWQTVVDKNGYCYQGAKMDGGAE